MKLGKRLYPVHVNDVHARLDRAGYTNPLTVVLLNLLTGIELVSRVFRHFQDEIVSLFRHSSGKARGSRCLALRICIVRRRLRLLRFSRVILIR